MRLACMKKYINSIETGLLSSLQTIVKKKQHSTNNLKSSYKSEASGLFRISTNRSETRIIVKLVLIEKDVLLELYDTEETKYSIFHLI